MTPNHNPETGIAFGVISADSLDPDLFNSLWDSGKDLSWEAAKAEIQAEIEREAENIEDEVHIMLSEIGGHTDREYEHALEKGIEDAYAALGFSDREDFMDKRLEDALDRLQIDEPTIEFTLEGVTGQIGWLGGAPLIWIFHSPIIGKHARCSPCAPGAVDLDNEGDYEGYDVPADWRADHATF